jgi:hypothetical protein
VKTTHPNLTNYSSSLPRRHNILQAQFYAYALHRIVGVPITPRLTYVPMGAGQLLSYNLAQDDRAVEREIAALRAAWDHYQDTGELPDVLPLDVSIKREARYGQVAFFTTDWQCSDAYCQFCDWEGPGVCCHPVRSQNTTGDRFAIMEGDEKVWVAKWANKLEILIPPGVPSMQFPPGKED